MFLRVGGWFFLVFFVFLDDVYVDFGLRGGF